MKIRVLISFSIVVLLLIFLLQGVGIYRAYCDHVKETQASWMTALNNPLLKE